MADSIDGPRRSPYIAPLVGGAVSALLYLTIALSVAFLLPLQVVCGRYGKGSGAAAAGVGAGIIAGVQILRLALSGALGAAELLTVLLPPFVLIAALVVLNAAFWEKGTGPYRTFIVTVIVAAAAAPALLSLFRDQAVMEYFQERIGALITPLKAQISGGGYDASALAASLDPTSLTASAINTLASCYAVLILAMLGGSRWLGNRLSGPGSRGRQEARPLSEYRLPYAFLWPFLGAWTFVAGAILLNGSPLIHAIAWNLALLFSAGYAVQGLGIASHILTRWNMPRTLKLIIVAIAILAVVTPTVGLVVVILIPVLGVTEVWIPYRNPKGVGA